MNKKMKLKYTYPKRFWKCAFGPPIGLGKPSPKAKWLRDASIARYKKNYGGKVIELKGEIGGFDGVRFIGKPF